LPLRCANGRQHAVQRVVVHLDAESHCALMLRFGDDEALEHLILDLIRAAAAARCARGMLASICFTRSSSSLSRTTPSFHDGDDTIEEHAGQLHQQGRLSGAGAATGGGGASCANACGGPAHGTCEDDADPTASFSASETVSVNSLGYHARAGRPPASPGSSGP
jgi:hypothetical protein